MNTIFLVLVGIVFIALFVVVFITLYFLRKGLEEKWRQEDVKKSQQLPGHKEVVKQYRKEKREAAQKAWQIAESIKDPAMRQVAFDILQSYGVVSMDSQYSVSGQIIIDAVSATALESKKLFAHTPAVKAKQTCRIARLIEACDIALEVCLVTDFFGDYYYLRYLRDDLATSKTLRYIKASTDIEAESFLSGMEKDIFPRIKKIVCLDCLQGNPRYCQSDHCLNCASKAYEQHCVDCAKALGLEVCDKCQTIKPLKLSKGQCVSCLKKLGYDVCLDCETVNPERCIECHDCLVCNLALGGDRCSSCYWIFYKNKYKIIIKYGFLALINLI